MERLVYTVILIICLLGCSESEEHQDSPPKIDNVKDSIAQPSQCEVCQDTMLAPYRAYLSKKGYAKEKDSCNVFEIRNEQFREAYGDQPVERCIFDYTDPEQQCTYLLSFFKCSGPFSPKKYYDQEYGPEREEWIKAPYAIFAKGDYLILVYAALEHHRPLLKKHSQELQTSFDLHHLNGN